MDVLVANANTRFDANVPDEVWLNNGSGQFALEQTLDVGNLGQTVELADVDNDGTLDAIVGGGGGEELWLNVAGTFVWEFDFPGDGSYGTSDIKSADVDNDGDIDLVFSYFNRDNEVFLNQGGDQGGILGTFALSTTFGPAGDGQ